MSAEQPVNFSHESLLKLKDVCARTAMGKTTIYRKIGDNTFPAPVSLGPKSSRWLKSEIDRWIEALTRQAA